MLGPGTLFGISAWLACKERITVHFKQPRHFLTACTPEGVARRSNLDVDETGLLENPLPACARQAAGDSSRPEIDVSHCRLRNGFAVCDIGEL